VSAVCAGLLGVAAAAQAPHSTEKIVLEAVPVNIDYRANTAQLRDVVITQGTMRIEAGEARVKGGLDFVNGEWTFSGKVRITAEGGNLRSDKATVSFRDNAISRAIITGTPAEFEQKRKDGNTARGHATTMDYETATGTVSFRDNAWLTPDGCNEISGPQLVYNIKAQRVGGQSTRTTSTTNDRITITIQPKDADGQKPCAAPAEKKP
jgi:lipopolysaccharide transport protein LptA